MNRQQWTAIALIMMLGVSEGYRVGTELALSDALLNNRDDQQVMDTADDLKEKMNQLSATLNDVKSGNSFFGFKLCLTTCPVNWAKIMYYQWTMKRKAEALVKEKFGGSGDVNRLHTVDPALAAEFHSTMRHTVWTFMQAVDNSAFQRILLTLGMGPGAALRFATGMELLGLCFFKKAWADMEANSDYRQKSTMWWSAMVAGCPEVDADLPDAFENKHDTEKLLNGMVFTLGKTNGVSDARDDAEMEAKWAAASSYTQCVLKQSRSGEYAYRKLHIEKGIISWTSSADCGSDIFHRVWSYLGHAKHFAMQFLTAKPGQDPVQVYSAKILGKQNNQGCIGLQNPYRKFTFCAYKDGETMIRAKEVIDEHLDILKDEREMLAMSAKLERLVATATSQDSDSKEVLKDFDNTGDSDVEDLSSKLGSGSRALGDSNEEREAQKILDKIKTGASLVESGKNITMGSMLLQEGYAEAHMHQGLSAVMEGRVEIKDSSLAIVADGGASAAAGSAGTLSFTEIMIILIVCGGGLICIGALGFAFSRVELSEEELPKLLGGNYTKS